MPPFFRAPIGPLELHYNLTQYATVYQLAEDQYIPGNLLIAVNSALGSTDGVNVNVSWVAGDDSFPGYKEGNGTEAMFRTIRSFEQWNRTHVLVVDEWNHCLRWVEREGENATSVFAGMCERMGEKDGYIEEAEFYQPTDIAINRAKKFVYVSDFKKGKVRMIDLYTDYIHTIFEGGNRSYPMGLALDARMNNLWITLSHGIKSLDVISGGGVINVTKQESGRNTSITSPISETQWQFPDKIIRLAPDLYAVADRSNRRIGLVDNSVNTVSSICARITRRIEYTVYANSTNCELYNPHGLAFIGTTLYIGTQKSIAKIQLDISAEIPSRPDSVTVPGEGLANVIIHNVNIYYFLSTLMPVVMKNRC